jgi:hypothetical protein
LAIAIAGIVVSRPVFVRSMSADSTQRKREIAEITEKAGYGASREALFLPSLYY